MIEFFQVDAFTDKAFSGNPAAVCLLEAPAETRWCGSVAAEMNLSETAFVVAREGGGFDLRWFTPKVEVDLCGHATLASAHALWESGRLDSDSVAEFHTKSGVLFARRSGPAIYLDFPSQPPVECTLPGGLADALAISPVWCGRNKADFFVHLATGDEVRNATPDFVRLGAIDDCRGVIVTAADERGEYDFVSRFFAPAAGIDEDPVTGSAHTCLAPWWAERTGRNEMTGFQASQRGGIVNVEVKGDRVQLGGKAVTVVHGKLLV